MTTPESIQVRIARLDFQAATYRDAAWNPVVDAEFAMEQGPRVLKIDLRERDELTGPLGYVPTAIHLPLGRVTELLQLGLDTRIALLSTDGRRASVAARMLELAGMTAVAAISGGLLAWRAAGLPSSRDPNGILDTLPGDPDYAMRPSGRPPGPLALHEVEAHVNDRTQIRWMKLAAFLLNGRTACVDGRDSQGVIGAPGGDAGELSLALAAAEACGATLSPACVRAVLRGWIEAFGRFYYHSDIGALNRMIAALRADPRIPESSLPSRDAPPSAWRNFQRSPPVELRSALLEHMVNPEHIGCGHLRLSMQRGADYGVRPAIVQEVLAAFYEAQWERLPEVEFVVLGGAHEEGGVLLVRLDEEVFPYTHLPLVPPTVRGVQMFVHHPEVTAYQRRQIAHWLARQPALPELAGRWEEVLEVLTALAGRQMGHTLSHLAAGLPIFEATFSSDRGVRVTQVGQVGG
jgi:rhodanese-related sulfurtransferase